MIMVQLGTCLIFYTLKPNNFRSQIKLPCNLRNSYLWQFPTFTFNSMIDSQNLICYLFQISTMILGNLIINRIISQMYVSFSSLIYISQIIPKRLIYRIDFNAFLNINFTFNLILSEIIFFYESHSKVTTIINI